LNVTRAVIVGVAVVVAVAVGGTLPFVFVAAEAAGCR
jgi:N-acetylmuramic acid 6-phosphate (MurNAc-6-P) etherase